MSSPGLDLPAAFGRAVAEGIPGILERQGPDGAIRGGRRARSPYPQQAIFPLAYCYAGRDPGAEYRASPRLA